jgi:Family of unknown function (DUF6516)
MFHGRDASLDALLGLDGQVYVISPDVGLWVQFIVRQVPVTEAKPHGLDYTLTLHRRDGERLVGFDNVHPVRGQAGPAGRTRPAQDHKHRLKSVRPYEYQDPASLLADFWAEVRSVCREMGVEI